LGRVAQRILPRGERARKVQGQGTLFFGNSPEDALSKDKETPVV